MAAHEVQFCFFIFPKFNQGLAQEKLGIGDVEVTFRQCATLDGHRLKKGSGRCVRVVGPEARATICLLSMVGGGTSGGSTCGPVDWNRRPAWLCNQLVRATDPEAWSPRSYPLRRTRRAPRLGDPCRTLRLVRSAVHVRGRLGPAVARRAAHARPVAGRPQQGPARLDDSRSVAGLGSAILDHLEEFFDRHDFFGVPVLNDDGVLLGVLQQNDVREAIEERAERDHMKARGLVGDELRTMPTLRRAGRRLSWLSANVLLNVVAAIIIAYYQDTLAAVIALVVFLPMLSDMSGCSGNQAVAVSLRELTLGVIRPADALRVWLKEISVGTINGLALALVQPIRDRGAPHAVAGHWQ